MTTALERNTMLIDAYAPRFDETRIEHLVIDAPTEPVYETMRDVDFMKIHSPITDLAMLIRSLPDRLGRLLDRSEPPAPPPPSLKLAALFDRLGFEGGEVMEGWVGLAEEHGRELVFGAVAKPWLADIEWKTVPAESFAGFDEPGWAKIVASLSVREYGAGRTILSYEARTVMTDAESRRRFHRYWTVVSPTVGVIMRALLRTVADTTQDDAGV